jgi:putative N6-adenine-specific DNA methylase
MPLPRPFEMFAVTAPGLAALTADELRTLGIAPGRVEPEGVTFSGGLRELYRANLHLRTASRVVVRVAEFTARSFPDLERAIRRVPWRDYLRPGTTIETRVTARKSKLYHSDAVAERVDRWVAEVLGDGVPGTQAPPSGASLILRLFHDRCTVSLDSSGELLHVRGYRQAVAKAPMRETLAAAMLLAAGWDGTRPLLDPMCGSGTIPIEAALLARRIAPGIAREFGFMYWAAFDRRLWAAEVAAAREAERPQSPVPIAGSDRDAGAVASAEENAARAGVGADIAFVLRSVSAIEPVGDAGWVMTNPPYGVRIGEADGLRDLYAGLGRTLARRFGGWRVALLSANAKLDRQLGIPLETLVRTSNGGIPVRIAAGEVPGD